LQDEPILAKHLEKAPACLLTKFEKITKLQNVSRCFFFSFSSIYWGLISENCRVMEISRTPLLLPTFTPWFEIVALQPLEPLCQIL